MGHLCDIFGLHFGEHIENLHDSARSQDRGIRKEILTAVQAQPGGGWVYPYPYHRRSITEGYGWKNAG